MPSQYLAYLFVLCILVVNNEVKAAQQLSTNGVEEPLEYKLTKLLDIHIGKDSSNLQSTLRNSIRSEVRNVLEGLKNELIDPKLQADLNDQIRYPTGLKVNENNNLLQALQVLHSDISWIKNNFSKLLSTSSSTYHDDVQNFINRSPVGVSYDNQVLNSEHLFPTLWKNSSYVPKNCKEIQLKGHNVSGIYKIQPLKTEKPFMALCDMETRGGGWTHIQKRYDGSQDFYLNWREYKFGFGNLEREFWLGLENIHSLTSSEANELLVEIVDRDNIKAHAHYKAFDVGPENDGYKLKVLNGFSGDAGDSLAYHVGSKFTTKDFDQDDNSDNCAVNYSGAWWYKSCHYSNLNGKYINSNLPKMYEYHGMHWKDFRGYTYAHSKSRMLVRPAQ